MDTKAYWEIDDLVEACERGTDDHDTGRVVAVTLDERGHEIVTVAWDSQVTTTVDVDDPRCDLCGITRADRDAIRFGAVS